MGHRDSSKGRHDNRMARYPLLPAGHMVRSHGLLPGRVLPGSGFKNPPFHQPSMRVLRLRTLLHGL